jgi:hypothetical protein
MNNYHMPGPMLGNFDVTTIKAHVVLKWHSITHKESNSHVLIKNKSLEPCTGASRL